MNDPSTLHLVSTFFRTIYSAQLQVKSNKTQTTRERSLLPPCSVVLLEHNSKLIAGTVKVLPPSLQIISHSAVIEEALTSLFDLIASQDNR